MSQEMQKQQPDLAQQTAPQSHHTRQHNAITSQQYVIQQSPLLPTHEIQRFTDKIPKQANLSKSSKPTEITKEVQAQIQIMGKRAIMSTKIIEFIQDYRYNQTQPEENMIRALMELIEGQSELSINPESKKNIRGILSSNENTCTNGLDLRKFTPNITTTSLFKLINSNSSNKAQLTWVQAQDRIGKSQSSKLLSDLSRSISRYLFRVSIQPLTNLNDPIKQKLKPLSYRILYLQITKQFDQRQLKKQISEQVSQQFLKADKQLSQNLHTQKFLELIRSRYSKASIQIKIIIDNIPTSFYYHPNSANEVYFTPKFSEIIKKLKEKFNQIIIIASNRPQYPIREKITHKIQLINIGKILEDSEKIWSKYSFERFWISFKEKLEKEINFSGSQVIKAKFFDQISQINLSEVICSGSYIDQFWNEQPVVKLMNSIKIKVFNKQFDLEEELKILAQSFSASITHQKAKLIEDKNQNDTYCLRYLKEGPASLGHHIESLILQCITEGKYISIPMIFGEQDQNDQIEVSLIVGYQSFGKHYREFLSNFSQIVGAAQQDQNKWIFGKPQKINKEWASNNTCFDMTFVRYTGSIYTVMTIDITIGRICTKLKNTFNFFSKIRLELLKKGQEQKYKFTHILVCKETTNIEKTLNTIIIEQDDELRQFLQLKLGNISSVSFDDRLNNFQPWKQLAFWQEAWQEQEKLD